MKIYKLDYNANQPSTKQISVPTDSNFEVGVKWEKNGEIQELEPECYKMIVDGTEISANQEKHNGYTTFNLSSDSNAVIKNAEIKIDKETEWDLSTNETYVFDSATTVDTKTFLSNILDEGETLTIRPDQVWMAKHTVEGTEDPNDVPDVTDDELVIPEHWTQSSFNQMTIRPGDGTKWWIVYADGKLQFKRDVSNVLQDTLTLNANSTINRIQYNFGAKGPLVTKVLIRLGDKPIHIHQKFAVIVNEVDTGIAEK